MDSLVDCTGYVGGNIAAHGKFDGLYNRKNIKEAFGTTPDILVYAGENEEQDIENQDSEDGPAHVREAINNIKNINPKKLVLISTIDVYDNPFMVTEEQETKGRGSYGKSMVMLEQWVKENVKDYLIVRLPELFGKGIKKNFIFDYIEYAPEKIDEKKFAELSGKQAKLLDFYTSDQNGSYRIRDLDREEKDDLRELLEDVKFSALNATDSRSVYQFYNLSNLYGDIKHGLKLGLKTVNIATEPVGVSDIYRAFTGRTFENEITETPACFDFRSLYFNEYTGYQADEGTGGYLYSKNEIIREIKKFADEEINI